MKIWFDTVDYDLYFSIQEDEFIQIHPYYSNTTNSLGLYLNAYSTLKKSHHLVEIKRDNINIIIIPQIKQIAYRLFDILNNIWVSRRYAAIYLKLQDDLFLHRNIDHDYTHMMFDYSDAITDSNSNLINYKNISQLSAMEANNFVYLLWNKNSHELSKWMQL